MTHPPSVAFVNLNAYEANINFIRKLVGDACHILAVVKADAYGHGLIPIARKALSAGAYGLAVATVEEGICLREANIHKPILVLMQPLPRDLEDAIKADLSLLVWDFALIQEINILATRLHKQIFIHLKIDTGMGRQGITEKEIIIDSLRYLTADFVQLGGIATHLAIAEEANSSYTRDQLARFDQIISQLATHQIRFGFIHAANSAAILQLGKKAAYNMVRPGLMTYGVPPSDSCPYRESLQPVLQWISWVTGLKNLPKGAAVGYGCTYVTPRHIRTALVPVGYADGYPWALSNRSDVLIHGKRCPVLGRVSMDQLVVDVSNLENIKVGDEVVLLGRSGNDEISAVELAQRANTIPYEILTRIGKRVKRVYIGDEE